MGVFQNVDRLYSFDPEYTDGTTTTKLVDTLIQPKHCISLKAVSLLLSNGAFFGDFTPRPLWDGIDYAQPSELSKAEYFGINGESIGWSSFIGAFSEAVEACIGEAQTVGVALSGGIDSAAVLCSVHGLSARRDLRILAFTTEQYGDDGSSNIGIAEQICKAVSPSIKLVRSSLIEEPTWDSRGPSLHAMPWSTSGQIGEAYREGVDVMLTGVGADEFLSAPRYLLSPLFKKDFRLGWAYLKLALENGWYGLVAEICGLIGSNIRGALGTKLYMASNYIAAQSLNSTSVLAEPYREYATSWDAAYMRQLFEQHCAANLSWAELDAFDTLYPLQRPIPSNSIVRTETPFLAEPFWNVARRLALVDRFDADLSGSYRRRKRLAAGLVWADVLNHISQAKVTYRGSIRRQSIPNGKDFALSVELGLFDPEKLQAPEAGEVLPTAVCIERWLRKAKELGYAFNAS